MITDPLLTIHPFLVADRLFLGDLGHTIYGKPELFKKNIENVPMVAEPVGSLNTHRVTVVQTRSFLPLVVITRGLPLHV